MRVFLSSFSSLFGVLRLADLWFVSRRDGIAGLSDYEVRDVNDDINKLLREKRHWENQIVALGGANYRRNVPMIDEDGKEVPGTKGYKYVSLNIPYPLTLCVCCGFSLLWLVCRYFGRAKELPGVKELFASKKKDEEEENVAASYYKKFLNHGPAYYGDLDEADGKLLQYEMEAEEQGDIRVGFPCRGMLKAVIS